MVAVFTMWGKYGAMDEVARTTITYFADRIPWQPIQCWQASNIGFNQ